MYKSGWYLDAYMLIIICIFVYFKYFLTQIKTLENEDTLYNDLN